MTKDEELAMDLALEALENNRRTHYYCEDIWYSCPKHEDGCANEAEGDECNCGADKANQEIDKAITAIKQARSAPVQDCNLAEDGVCEALECCKQPAPVQEPVALPCCGYTDASAVKWNPFNGVVQCHNCGQTYAPPAAQRQCEGCDKIAKP
jgi:hypothetical protein